jgi:hypothetical protein
MRGFAHLLHILPAIVPAAAIADNTPQVSQIIPLAGYSQLAFAIALGALADADATFTVLVEHGDDPALADAAAVPDAQLTGTEASASFNFADDGKVRKIGYVGSKAYVRLTVTPANNAGNAFIAAVAILSGARHAPTAPQSG